MYCIIQPLTLSIRYAVFTQEAEVIYTDTVAVRGWDEGSLKNTFTSDILPKLRTQAKIFTKIGIVIPYADRSYTRPQKIEPTLLKVVSGNPFAGTSAVAVKTLSNLCTKTWPHLPQYALFDTFYGAAIERVTHVPALSYDDTKANNLTPTLLNSYGHAANIHHAPSNAAVVSVYVDEHISIARFADGHIHDLIPTYSATSPMMGLFGMGNLDAGTYNALAQKMRPAQLEQFLTQKTGLFPMVEHAHPLDTLFQLSGLVPRTSLDALALVSIESIEWIELAVRQFIRTIRHSIGAMLYAPVPVHSVIVNAAHYPKDHPLWKHVLDGLPNSVKVQYAQESLLEAACRDLAHADRKR